VCPLPTTTPANQKTTCGQCRANVCVEASKKFCKTASKNARQAEIEGSAAAIDTPSATVRTSV
jgi:23S rRNA G2445 N2-methylase RlmL